MDYVDEASLEPDQDVKKDYQLPVFSKKKVYLEGVTVYASEFSVPRRNNTFENENQVMIC